MLQTKLSYIYTTWEKLHDTEYLEAKSKYVPRDSKSFLFEREKGFSVDSKVASLFVNSSSVSVSKEGVNVTSPEITFRTQSSILGGDVYIYDRQLNPSFLFSDVLVPNLYDTFKDETIVMGVAQPELGQYNIQVKDLMSPLNVLERQVRKQRSFSSYPALKKLAGEYDKRYKN